MNNVQELITEVMQRPTFISVVDMYVAISSLDRDTVVDIVSDTLLNYAETAENIDDLLSDMSDIVKDISRELRIAQDEQNGWCVDPVCLSDAHDHTRRDGYYED